MRVFQPITIGLKHLKSPEQVDDVDLTTFVASVALDYDDDSYDFGGLAYNTADGLFYGTSDDTARCRCERCPPH